MNGQRKPTTRKLRVFAFDPMVGNQPETAFINEITLKVPWEDDLQPGPVGEYLEVVDVDPVGARAYPPVDLNDRYILAGDGLTPSEGYPQFHQQMVYAVAMTTIRNFEIALGRRALWAPHREENKEEFVRRLRIYPHALLEANAYYSPAKKAILFGYFPADVDAPGKNLPGGMIYTCLSHDIIAHEITHALLDGLHRRFIEPSNVDVLAFHEAFADLIALFQHFSFADVLRHQIARTRGDLSTSNLLVELAQQFGQAIGAHGALRSALDANDSRASSKKPDTGLPIATTIESHARGAILVAAVFDAFLTVYRERTQDLFRIATSGTGVLPEGALHPDLVSRLADEAAKVARHFLRICIRALDYCPPVDLTFGDYLRALITSDADLVPDDQMNYRRAIIEAFRRRGIYPMDVRSLSEESLLWKGPTQEEQSIYENLFETSADSQKGRRKSNKSGMEGEEEALRRVAFLRNAYLSGKLAKEAAAEFQIKAPTFQLDSWGLDADRERVYLQNRQRNIFFHTHLSNLLYNNAWSPRDRHLPFGLCLAMESPASIFRGDDGKPTLEVHSVRPTRRLRPDGEVLTDLVVVLTQRRRGYFDEDLQQNVDSGKKKPLPPDFVARGGCTLLISLETGELRYVISKGITSEARLAAQRRFLREPTTPSLQFTYFGDARLRLYEEEGVGAPAEPFALLHRAPEIDNAI